MSILLPLAADFIENMSNAALGIATNEDYAIKFGQLLESKGFASHLRREVESLREPHALSSHGWLWLIGWARSARAPMDEELLRHLFHEWSGPFIRAEIILLATQDAGHKPRNVNDTTVPEFPNSFLRRILLEVTASATESEEQHKTEQHHLPATTARGLLVALLQAGSPIALDAASALLRHEWEGQERLLESFWALLHNLDSETQRLWLDRLSPPHLPSAE